MKAAGALFCPTSFALAALLLGCASGPEGETSEISYGRQACAECGRVIEQRRFAARYHLPNGAVSAFDDPVCLLKMSRDRDTGAARVQFHDHQGDRWLSSDEVWFARTPRTDSPAGHGWAAYASFGEAQEAVTSAGSGEILRYEQLAKRIQAAKSSLP